MDTSWIEQGKQFKSPLNVVAGFLVRSRQTEAKRANTRAREIQQLNKTLETQQPTITKLREELATKTAQIARLEIGNQKPPKQPPTIPLDLPLRRDSRGI